MKKKTRIIKTCVKSIKEEMKQGIKEKQNE